MKRIRLSLGVLAVAAAPSLLHAAVLTDIPMQGGMVMPMVDYDAGMNMMMVTMPTNVPQLTPLLVSNPGDSFDPADPWFDALDPSCAGAAFSQSYGFMMDAMSDFLPAGAQMWIRKISGPPGLNFYTYSSSPPLSFDPIFSTDGATNALYWDGEMFHPVVTAPPGTNTYAATFEIYLVDGATGQEMTNTSSGPLVFTWTDVPDGRPALSLALGAGIVVSWPSATTTNWALEAANAVNATTWMPVTNSPVTAGGQTCVILPGSAPQEYFRMRYVP